MQDYLSHFTSLDWILSVIITSLVIGVIGSLIASYVRDFLGFLWSKVSSTYKEKLSQSDQKRKEYIDALRDNPVAQLEAHQRFLYHQIKSSHCVSWQVGVCVVFVLWGISLNRFDWNIYGLFLIVNMIPTFGYYYHQGKGMYFVTAIGSARNNL